MTAATAHQRVLAFWFDEVEPGMWWTSDPDFDALIRDRFLVTHGQAVRGELSAWRAAPHGRLAEVIVLDQFSRNMFRDTPQAFAQDGVALQLAQEAIAAGAHLPLSVRERSFLYMPFMHSESTAIHADAERLFREEGMEGSYRSELQHKAIIDRFGRYPHRNSILGRVSTAEEIAFLQQSASRF